MDGSVFGFHESKYYNRKTFEVLATSDEGNGILWESYPEHVKARLGRLTPYMVYIKGTDLLPPCK